MNSRNAKIWVYEERGLDVVPPFLVGEVAGSLMIAEDREQIKKFADSILEWLEKTASADCDNVYRFTCPNGTDG